MDTDRIFKLT